MLKKKDILIFAIPGGIIIVLILTLLVFQLTKTETPPEAPETTALVETNTVNEVNKEQQTIEIPLYAEIGKPMKLGLYANPTTGFQWSTNFDDSFFKLNDSYYIAKGDENLVGSGGTQYFEFETLKIGDSDIRFEYKRPWEENISPDKVTIYQVHVSEEVL